MAKRASTPQETTDFSWADRYLEDRRIPKYWRIKAKFPLVEDRKAANIDYYSEEMRREFRGSPPKEFYSYDKLDLPDPPDLSNAQFLFVNDAQNVSHIPEGYKATESGIEPDSSIPFTEGDTTDHPIVINSDFENNVISGDIFLAKNIETANMNGELYPYYPSYSGNVGRFEWEISQNYNTPIEPETRFPNGARKRRFFNN